MRLYFLRHAQSEANALDLLAGRIDYPLSPAGREEAAALARAFLPGHPIEAILCSPLARARQTAAPFAEAAGLEPGLREYLAEQDMGAFAGKSYAEAEADPRYERDRSRRWDWSPPGGESYRAIAERLLPFFGELDASLAAGKDGPVLVVTHAVTLRLIVAHLEASLPAYPTALARNAEILAADYRRLGFAHRVESLYYGSAAGAKE